MSYMKTSTITIRLDDALERELDQRASASPTSSTPTTLMNQNDSP